jgi:hypothetical protein
MTHARSVLDNFALMKLRIQGEYSIQVPTSALNTTIMGIIDYALGYGDYRLESVMVAVEVKKITAYSDALPQLICHLGMSSSLTAAPIRLHSKASSKLLGVFPVLNANARCVVAKRSQGCIEAGHSRLWYHLRLLQLPICSPR